MTRGLIPIIILRHLEEICGQPIHALFDFVCGTSTGCILASLLCLEKLSANECKKYYFSLSHDVFKMNNLLGMSQLFLNHAFYDSKLLQKQIRLEFIMVNQCFILEISTQLFLLILVILQLRTSISVLV